LARDRLAPRRLHRHTPPPSAPPSTPPSPQPWGAATSRWAYPLPRAPQSTRPTSMAPPAPSPPDTRKPTTFAPLSTCSEAATSPAAVALSGPPCGDMAAADHFPSREHELPRTVDALRKRLCRPRRHNPRKLAAIGQPECRARKGAVLPDQRMQSCPAAAAGAASARVPLQPGAVQPVPGGLQPRGGRQLPPQRLCQWQRGAAPDALPAPTAFVPAGATSLAAVTPVVPDASASASEWSSRRMGVRRP